MVTIAERSRSRSRLCMVSTRTRPRASSMAVKALMSAPAQNSVGLAEAQLVRARERRGNDPGAGHHAQIHVADLGEPLLDDQAALDQRLEGKPLDQLAGQRLGLSRAHRTPGRSWPPGCRLTPARAYPGVRRSAPRSTPSGARPRAGPCQAPAGPPGRTARSARPWTPPPGGPPSRPQVRPAPGGATAR